MLLSSECTYETELVKPNTIGVNALVFKSISASHMLPFPHYIKLISDFSAVGDFWLLLSFSDQHFILFYFIFSVWPK